MGEPPAPTASLTPQSGVTYTDGLPSDWNIMKEIAKAISEASDSINANTTEPIYVNKGNRWAYKITPGDTISVTSTAGTYAYAVMGFNNFALTNKGNYGGTHSTAGLTFGSVNCLDKTYEMSGQNDTNSGGWGQTKMHTSTMPTLQNGMPETLAQVKVPYAGKGGILYSDDYLFLPAEKEVFGTPTYSPTAEANALTQFAYYKNGGSTIKKQGNSPYDDAKWWLRSIYYDTNKNFCRVKTSGEASYNIVFIPEYVAPCFCV